MRGSRASVSNAPPAVVHLTADLLGVSASQLADQSLICGVMVSAAGAAGMTATGSPVVLRHPDTGLSVILPVDGCHMSIHTMPDRELAILDVLASPGHDTQRALDVVTRRIVARTVRTERRTRG
ncbi:MAG TPA: S-adenosylmethionine decarboxylase [Gemmatimonadaceae bacterium]